MGNCATIPGTLPKDSFHVKKNGGKKYELSGTRTRSSTRKTFGEFDNELTMSRFGSRSGSFTMPSRNSTTAHTMTQTVNTYNGGSMVYGVLGGYSGGMRPRSLTDEYKLAHNSEAETLMNRSPPPLTLYMDSEPAAPITDPPLFRHSVSHQLSWRLSKSTRNLLPLRMSNHNLRRSLTSPQPNASQKYAAQAAAMLQDASVAGSSKSSSGSPLRERVDLHPRDDMSAKSSFSARSRNGSRLHPPVTALDRQGRPRPHSYSHNPAAAAAALTVPHAHAARQPKPVNAVGYLEEAEDVDVLDLSGGGAPRGPADYEHAHNMTQARTRGNSVRSVASSGKRSVFPSITRGGSERDIIEEEDLFAVRNAEVNSNASRSRSAHRRTPLREDVDPFDDDAASAASGSISRRSGSPSATSSHIGMFAGHNLNVLPIFPARAPHAHPQPTSRARSQTYHHPPSSSSSVARTSRRTPYSIAPARTSHLPFGYQRDHALSVASVQSTPIPASRSIHHLRPTDTYGSHVPVSSRSRPSSRNSTLSRDHIFVHPHTRRRRMSPHQSVPHTPTSQMSSAFSFASHVARVQRGSRLPFLLPSDILLFMFDYMDPRAVIAVKRTSRQFCEQADRSLQRPRVVVVPKLFSPGRPEIIKRLHEVVPYATFYRAPAGGRHSFASGVEGNDWIEPRIGTSRYSERHSLGNWMFQLTGDPDEAMLSQFRPPDEALLDVAELKAAANPHLRSLCLSGGTQQSLSTISALFPHLVSLSVRMNRGELSLFFLKGARSLRALTVRASRPDEPLAGGFEALAGLPSLTALCFACGPFSERSIRELIRCVPRELKLLGLRGKVDGSLEQLAERCPRLEELCTDEVLSKEEEVRHLNFLPSLRACATNSDVIFTSDLVPVLPNLLGLRITRFVRDSTHALATKCPNLRLLRLDRRNPKNDCLLSRAQPSLSRLRHLQSLVVVCYPVFTECVEMLARLPALRSLTLEDCSIGAQFTDLVDLNLAHLDVWKCFPCPPSAVWASEGISARIASVSLEETVFSVLVSAARRKRRLRGAEAAAGGDSDSDDNWEGPINVAHVSLSRSQTMLPDGPLATPQLCF